MNDFLDANARVFDGWTKVALEKSHHIIEVLLVPGKVELEFFVEGLKNFSWNSFVGVEWAPWNEFHKDKS